MATFLPSFEQATFSSEGEHNLYRLLSQLDDEFIVIHSCPWLRASSTRIFCKEKHKYIELFRNDKRNVTGEIDFIIAHPRYGLLCIEVKTGDYIPFGSRFVHATDKHVIDPLGQVKNNAFTTIDFLKFNSIDCPVGYAIYLCKSAIASKDLGLGFHPIGNTSLSDGIVILPEHEQRMAPRILELFKFWSATSNYYGRADFGAAVTEFVEKAWPEEILDEKLGRKISCDNNMWLKLDNKQHKIVAKCAAAPLVLVAGFAGTGKTIIASSVAASYAEAGKRVLFIFKNKKISQHIAAMFDSKPYSGSVAVLTFHSFCDRIGSDDPANKSDNFDTHYRHLLNKKDAQYDCLIVDEAQGLSEEEHRALQAYFEGKNKYFFADQHQIFRSIEKGVDYEFLEKLYGEKFNYLTSVYRSPRLVTDRILEIISSQYEIVNHRSVEEKALLQYFVVDVEEATRKHVARLLGEGAKEADIVILTQYAIDFRIGNIHATSIAGFRGMESPIAIIWPELGMDDNTLACALGRCTTQAIVLVDIAGFGSGADKIASSYLRQKVAAAMPEWKRHDSLRPNPVFIENLVRKHAAFDKTYLVGTAEFSFSAQWRAWVFSSPVWPNSEASLWGMFFQEFTRTKMYGLDVQGNILGRRIKLAYCVYCDGVMPHDIFTKQCETCCAAEPDMEAIDALDGIFDRSASVDDPDLKTVLNVIDLIHGSDRLYDKSGNIESWGRDADLFLGGIIIQFYGEKLKAAMSRDQIAGWFDHIFERSTEGPAIKDIVTKTISSMCARRLMQKVDRERYRLIAGEVQ